MTEMKRFVSSSKGPSKAAVADLCGNATTLVNTGLNEHGQGVQSYQGTCYVESRKLNVFWNEIIFYIMSYTLYYTIQYYTILYYTILYYIILYYTIIYYPILYYTTPYCATLHST